jgi:hypothetical protein
VCSSDLKHFCATRGKPLPDYFLVSTESNYILSENGHLSSVKEYFLHFYNDDNAAYVLGLEAIRLPLVGNITANIKFAKPARDAATRKLWRTIGQLIERVKAIDDELAEMGAVRELGHDMPSLPKNVLDMSFFSDKDTLPAWEATRALGGSLGYRAYTYLRNYTPVNTAPLQARIKQLYDEQCDALLVLRKHQISGLAFLF